MDVSVQTTFYVLSNLICDVLMGEDFLDFQAVFERYGESMVICTGQDSISELNPIVWPNRFEQGISRMLGKGPGEVRPESGQTQLCHLIVRDVYGS